MHGCSKTAARLALGLAGLALLTPSSAAGAGSASSDGDRVFVSAGAGDDRMTIGVASARYRITSTTGITAVAGPSDCSQTSPTEVSCGIRPELFVHLGAGTDELDVAVRSAAPAELTVFGAGGPDRVQVDTSFRSHLSLSMDSGNDILGWTGGRGRIVHGGEGADRIRGGPLADVIWGDEGNDVLNGRRGNDRVDGVFGSDTVRGGGGRDRLIGGRPNDRTGRDRLFGGAGPDYLAGGPARDRLFGRGGRDRLFGQAGADRLNGGAGRDVGAGGAGRDFFRLVERILGR